MVPDVHKLQHFVIIMCRMLGNKQAVCRKFGVILIFESLRCWSFLLLGNTKHLDIPMDKMDEFTETVMGSLYQ